MLRSFVISHLRRHDRRSLAQLDRCGACWTKSRGYVVDHPIKRRHMYLVLDDWNNGFSIHKLDPYDGSDDGGSGHLPLPAPVHRQEKMHVVSRGHWEYDRFEWNFAALGSKIVAAGALDPDEDGVTLAYDTETAAVSAVPRLPAPLRCPWTLGTAVGNGLYVFEPNSEPRASRWNPGFSRKRDVVVGNGMHRLDAPGRDRHHWTWTSISSTLPFRVCDMESSAVQPEEGGGRGTLVVSAGRWDRKQVYDGKDDDKHFTRTPETFSYTGGGQWQRHGQWDLPFYGHGQYDGELDACVGLHKIHDPGHNHALKMDGYLCSSDVVSPNGSTAQPPSWKLCEERLFDPRNVGHVGASLVYMGDSTYCLVEVKALEKFEDRSVGNKSTVRLAVFRLKYGKSGELTIAARRPDRSYLFSRFDDSSKVRAFWI